MNKESTRYVNEFMNALDEVMTNVHKEENGVVFKCVCDDIFVFTPNGLLDEFVKALNAADEFRMIRENDRLTISMKIKE